MSKVKYLVGRIKNMNFKKMFDTIDDIHNRTDKSKIFLFFDMIICAIKYQSGYVDYLLFEMWNLNLQKLGVEFSFSNDYNTTLMMFMWK